MRSDMQGCAFGRYSTVAVVGLGKIGLPLAVQYAEHGWCVLGCDISPVVVDTVNAGQSHVEEEPGLAARVARLVEEGLLAATLDTAAAVRRAEVVVVIVPVVVDKRHEVDFAGIDAATVAVGAGLQPGTLVVYETTLPVGTTSTRLRGLLERESGLQAGRDFYLAYSPERVSSGHIFRDLRTYPKVLGGVDEPSLRAGVAFYRSVLEADIITMASADEAEFVKLIETTYRDVNIALANEFACFADARGLDVATAIVAANTQPYSHIHSPGIGVGGHCIPVYPYFLLAGAGQALEHQDSPASMLELPRMARRVNDSMAAYAVRRVENVLGAFAGKAALVLGIAYRGDVRESAFTSANLIRDALLERGATVYADDPLFSDDELRSLGYTPLAQAQEAEIEAIFLQADHQAYRKLDFSRFTRCKVVLDGRGALRREQIEALGMRYVAIGDGDRKEKPGREGGVQPVAASLVWNGGGE